AGARVFRVLSEPLQPDSVESVRRRTHHGRDFPETLAGRCADPDRALLLPTEPAADRDRVARGTAPVELVARHRAEPRVLRRERRDQALVLSAVSRSGERT